MKKTVQLLSILLLAGSISFGQNKDNKWSFGGHFGTQEYKGELANEFFGFSHHAAYGLSLSHYINPTWDVSLLGTFSNLDASDSLGSFLTKMGDINLIAKLKLNNGKILKEDSKFAPYLFIGLGDAFSRTYQENTPSYRLITPNFLGGAGFKIPFNDRWALDLMMKYSYAWSDKLDARFDETKFQDQFLTTTAGLVYSFSAKKDSDKDGVADKDDKCPTVFGLAKFNGCPDTDADGVQDSEDACPKTPGTLKGCPDTDKDGIADKDDACSTVAGIAKFNGCPDTDGDGVKDSEDKCPKVAGTLAGCPDSDKDGVADKDDACPKVYGTIKGCPDTDKDGVIDSKDKCPKVKGVKSNNGCPEEADEESKQVFKEAMEGLFFNTGSAVIKTSSYPVLDKVVMILKSHPTYKLDIDGHTDSQGNAAKNMQLSKDRAAAAKTYLVNKGIDASRLTDHGFGITQPRADNATPQGRALNRRVEFKAIFK